MKKSRFFQFFALGSLFVFLLSFLVADFVQAEKPDTPPGQDKGKPEPSAPILYLNDYNIVTAEPDGTGYLHVWGYNGSSYEKIWTAESVHHSSVAIGDIDGDNKREIVAPTSCKIEGKAGKGPKGTSYYKYYINVYKEDFDATDYERGIWRSTFYDGLENNIQETNHWSSEIAIANVDVDSLNEVVLLTANYIAIFRYDKDTDYAYIGEPGVFQRIALLSPENSVGGASLVMRSLACGDIDNDGMDEILIAANVPGLDANQSYILAYDYNAANTDTGLDLKFVKSIDDASIGHQSLRIADLDGDESVELCSPAYKYENGEYQSYIFIWEKTEGDWFGSRYDFLIISEADWPWNHLDAGELSDSPGDEIVLSIGNSRKLIRYECTREGGSFQLIPVGGETFVDPTYSISGVNIADVDGIVGNEIVVSGGSLEVYSSDLTWMWRRIEAADDGEIWYVAIGVPII
jgi:hypothetical protein